MPSDDLSNCRPGREVTRELGQPALARTFADAQALKTALY